MKDQQYSDSYLWKRGALLFAFVVAGYGYTFIKKADEYNKYKAEHPKQHHYTAAQSQPKP